MKVKIPKAEWIERCTKEFIKRQVVAAETLSELELKHFREWAEALWEAEQDFDEDERYDTPEEAASEDIIAGI